MHWHGIRLPNAMDGVPGITQTTSTCQTGWRNSRSALTLPGAQASIAGISLSTKRTRAGPGRSKVVRPSEASGRPAPRVWTYNGVEPGPVLRLCQGTAFRATVGVGRAGLFPPVGFV
jgi:FtsP/CotA-like multicopper oxidase with cupredoxin domain